MAVLLTLIFVTAFWAAFASGGFVLTPHGPNQGLLRTMVIMTAVCCYLFWLVVFLHQINPLIGPEIPARTIRFLADQWGNSVHMPPSSDLSRD